MKIYLSPQVNDKKIVYSFDGEVITATYKDEADVFDFTSLPIGIMDSVESTLSIDPIIYAERKVDGLYVKLLNYIDEDADESERFPNWEEI